MNVEEAAAILKATFPDRTITGYWKKDVGYVFQSTNPLDGLVIEPAQYVVTQEGKVYGTNPMVVPLGRNDLIPLEDPSCALYSKFWLSIISLLGPICLRHKKAQAAYQALEEVNRTHGNP